MAPRHKVKEKKHKSIDRDQQYGRTHCADRHMSGEPCMQLPFKRGGKFRVQKGGAGAVKGPPHRNIGAQKYIKEHLKEGHTHNADPHDPGAYIGCPDQKKAL